MTLPSTSPSIPPATAPLTDTPDWATFAAQIRDGLLSRAVSWAVTAYTASDFTEEDDAEASVATAAARRTDEKAAVDTGTRRDTTLADTARSSAHNDSWDLPYWGGWYQEIISQKPRPRLSCWLRGCHRLADPAERDHFRRTTARGVQREDIQLS